MNFAFSKCFNLILFSGLLAALMEQRVLSRCDVLFLPSNSGFPLRAAFMSDMDQQVFMYKFQPNISFTVSEELYRNKSNKLVGNDENLQVIFTGL